MSSIVSAFDKHLQPKQLCEKGHVEFSWSVEPDQLITQFFFQLVRSKDTSDLQNQLGYLLGHLRWSNNESQLLILYKLIGQTRDIVGGKGECDLTWMQLEVWSRFYPELAYQEKRTAKKVAKLLKEFGVDEIHEGIGGTGVVGVIRNGKGPMVGLRADMDALPITEANQCDHASTHEGVMHACGHDGHTTMLLGAARYLSETRNFNGQVILIFQPAEEGFAGAKAMIEDGLFEKFPVDSIYGMHNMPGVAEGN